MVKWAGYINVLNVETKKKAIKWTARGTQLSPTPPKYELRRRDKQLNRTGRKGWLKAFFCLQYGVCIGRRQSDRCYLAYSGKYININFILKIPYFMFVEVL